MRLKLTIRYSSMINILIALIIISYVGPFASYKGSLLLIGLLGGCLFLLSGINGMFSKKHIAGWTLLFVYLTLNSLLNLPNSAKYMLVFTVGYVLISRDLEAKDYKQVYLICKVTAIIEGFSIMTQYYAPSIFYSFAQKWFFYSNQYDQVVYLGQYCKQYSGIFYEVSFAALILSFGIIIIAVEMFEELKVSRKIFNLLVGGVLFYAVILTGKRSFMLIVPVVIVALYLIKIRQKLTIRHLIIAFIGFVVLAFSMNKIIDIFFAIVSKGSGHTVNLSSRELFWGLAFTMFKEQPLIGKGLNSFDSAFNASGIRSVYYDFAGAHNSYIQLLGETGILGFLLYTSAIIGSLHKGVKTLIYGCREEIYLYGAIGMLFVMITYALSGNVLYQPQQLIAFFWLIAIIENYYQTLQMDSGYSGGE